jgi:hypothetical protein
MQDRYYYRQSKMTLLNTTFDFVQSTEPVILITPVVVTPAGETPAPPTTTNFYYTGLYEFEDLRHPEGDGNV